MRILLTNDDGFDAPGIQALFEELSKSHEVWIVAPEFNKSGASASINLTSPSVLKVRGKNLYTLSGTPVDCVMACYKGDFLPSLPDLIISGINDGGNLGTDVVYSGTCAAARQGTLYDIPSVAVSLEKHDWNDPTDYYFAEMAQFVSKNLDLIYRIASSDNGEKFIDAKTGNEYKRMFFLNINAPSVPSYKGVKWASLTKKTYNDKFVTEDNCDGTFSTRLVFGPESLKCGEDNMDCTVIRDDYVSLSLIRCIPDSYVADFDVGRLFVI